MITDLSTLTIYQTGGGLFLSLYVFTGAVQMRGMIFDMYYFTVAMKDFVLRSEVCHLPSTLATTQR